MSAEANPSLPLMSDAAEPKATPAPVPVGLIVLLFLILYGGMIYFDQRGGWFNPQVYAPYQSLAEVTLYQPPTGGPDLGKGKAVFDNICALCHGPDGAGKPNQAPPLAGSEWAQGSPNRVIRIPLLGLTGPIQVKGQEWNLAMTPFNNILSDDDLAAVLTYVRQSWGNKASAITPEQVKAIRADLGNRNQPATADYLNTIQ
jgi:mono/diheme cytochrome c family protein